VGRNHPQDGKARGIARSWFLEVSLDSPFKALALHTVGAVHGIVGEDVVLDRLAQGVPVAGIERLGLQHRGVDEFPEQCAALVSLGITETPVRDHGYPFPLDLGHDRFQGVLKQLFQDVVDLP